MRLSRLPAESCRCRRDLTTTSGDSAPFPLLTTSLPFADDDDDEEAAAAAAGGGGSGGSLDCLPDPSLLLAPPNSLEEEAADEGLSLSEVLSGEAVPAEASSALIWVLEVALVTVAPAVGLHFAYGKGGRKGRCGIIRNQKVQCLPRPPFSFIAPAENCIQVIFDG